MSGNPSFEETTAWPGWARALVPLSVPAGAGGASAASSAWVAPSRSWVHLGWALSCVAATLLVREPHERQDRLPPFQGALFFLPPVLLSLVKRQQEPAWHS